MSDLTFEETITKFVIDYKGDDYALLLDVFFEEKAQLESSDLFEGLWRIFCDHREMPYEVANNGDPYAYIEEVVDDILFGERELSFERFEELFC